MSGQQPQYGDWHSRPPFVPAPFSFSAPMHDFSRPPPTFLPRPPRPPTQYFNTPTRLAPHQQPPAEITKNEDQEWVDCWLRTKITSGPTNPGTGAAGTLKISDVKQKVARSATLLRELVDFKNQIQTSDGECRAKILSEIINHKSELTEITSFLESTAPQIKCLVDKQRKKHQAQKAAREKYRALKQKQTAERQAKHRQIDAWLQEQRDKVEKAKREDDTCREADAVLCEVRNKQSDGKGLLQVLQSLRKLRVLRAQHAADKNMYPSEDENERFENMLSKLDDLWQLQLEDYGKEEQTLRVMMEKDKVVRQEKQIPSSFEVNLDQWQIALFGNRKSLEYETLVHTAAEQDVHSLVHTRQCWDQFVVTQSPLSSRIPVGWVVPCRPSSSEWENLLASKQ